jgi:glycosyltransferase involved in cell wall biosynthesis
VLDDRSVIVRPVKLSLMIPTFQSAETIERTLTSALAQEHRPLEILVYDECSTDSTREIVRQLLAHADPGIEARLLTSEENSGPVRAWRVALHAITGDWCTFVWADDVLKPSYSTTMMAAAARAADDGRKLVTCSAEIEEDGDVLPYYALDEGVATDVEYSEGIFLRRFPLSQICSVFETNAAREVFDRHIEIENPRGFDYERHPYGNDVGFLSELAAEGGGVELIGERLVTLVLSSSSMTRHALREHIWQHRWQYTFTFLRVWGWWVARGVPDATRIRDMAERRLALCSLMLGGFGLRFRPALYPKAVRAYLEYRRFDYQVTHSTLDEHRGRIAGRRREAAHPSHSLT